MGKFLPALPASVKGGGSVCSPPLGGVHARELTVLP